VDIGVWEGVEAGLDGFDSGYGKGYWRW